MQLALYKGPATNFWFQVAHRAVCLFTKSQYSHCEIVINGMGYTASHRDGGVRGKHIDFSTGRWDIIEIPGNEKIVLEWFKEHAGEKYDFVGVLRFLFPWLPKFSGQWFCSEACASALGFPHPENMTPADLGRFFNE